MLLAMTALGVEPCVWSMLPNSAMRRQSRTAVLPGAAPLPMAMPPAECASSCEAEPSCVAYDFRRSVNRTGFCYILTHVEPEAGIDHELSSDSAFCTACTRAPSGSARCR